MATKTRAEIEELKRQWLDDACWDLFDSEGFEDYREELRAFQTEQEARWKREAEVSAWNAHKPERDARWARIESAAVAFVANGHFDAERAIEEAQELIGALDAARAAEESANG